MTLLDDLENAAHCVAVDADSHPPSQQRYMEGLADRLRAAAARLREEMAKHDNDPSWADCSGCKLLRRINNGPATPSKGEPAPECAHCGQPGPSIAAFSKMPDGTWIHDCCRFGCPTCDTRSIAERATPAAPVEKIKNNS